MHCKRWVWGLVEVGLAWALMVGMALAQVATTTVQDTVFRGDGTAAGGTVLVSWPAFATATGAAIPAGSTSVTIGAGGVLRVVLVPNAGSTPIGSYYTVVYHLNDGSTTREYWVVPASAGAVKLSAIRSSVLPTSVAMQTVSRSYVDTAIAAAVAGRPLDSSPYVLKAGDTMGGPLVLPGDPAAPLQAADKSYVDTQVAAVSGGGAQKVSLVPQASQIVVQPTGSELQANKLNGFEDATTYATGAGSNGIANAAASADCTAGCAIANEQSYGGNGNVASTETAQPTAWNSRTQLDDARGGERREAHFNPLDPAGFGLNAGHTIDVVSTQTADAVKAAIGSTTQFSTGLAITSEAFTGGSNEFPQLVQGAVPYFKSTYSALTLTGTNNTPGQHVLVPTTQNCYGVGDCLMGSQYMLSSGGFRDDADEGAHPFDLQYAEDTRVFTGQCAAGCTAGSTSVQVSGGAAAGTQGEGRYLIDTNPAKVLTNAGGSFLTIGDPNSGRQPIANFSGTNFAVSTLLATAQTIPSQANSIKPGTVTVAIVTSGAPAGFATNTAALPSATGVACVSDVMVIDQRPLNFETAAYRVVDGSHLQMTLHRPHATGATVAVGGLCGYGLEQTVDTRGGIRQVFPVIGSTSPTQVLYAGGLTSLLGVQGLQSAYTNVNAVLANLTRANGTVTVTLAGKLPVDLNGLTVAVSGVADASFNGSFVASTTTANTFTYAESGADASTTGGTVSYLTGGYAFYPMAEVLGVFNPATHAVDGLLQLAANTAAWAPGDAVEEPHYFQEKIAGDVQLYTQYEPRPASIFSAGVQYAGNNGPGLYGWLIQNASPVSQYFGNGGTHNAPSAGLAALGVWRDAMQLEAGENAAIFVDCNSHGCDKWNSKYDLFQMQTSVGVDRQAYDPAISSLAFALRGTAYVFNPQSFTAPTINVTTLNAGTIKGQFTGTIAAASLPVFAGSGTTHAAGAVPDPGPNAGTTRFLREDGQFAVPAGGTGGNASGTATGTAAITGGTIDNAAIGGTTAASGFFTVAGVGTTTPATLDARAALDVQSCPTCGVFLESRQNGDTPNMVFKGAGYREVSMDAYNGSFRFISEQAGGGGGYVMAAIDGNGGSPGTMHVYGPLQATNFNGILSGLSGPIGGSALAPGACTVGTISVAGAGVGQPVAVAAADGSLPQGLVEVSAAVTQTNVVAVQLCAAGAVTPAAKTYAVRVIQ